jgi:hypothetical protein
MKKTSTILAIGSALALGSAQAEIESSFHVGYSTDYVFRGANQGGAGEGLYEYGIDFSGDASGGATWNAGVWRADFADGASEETDIYGSVSKEFGAVDLSLGLIRYDYGNGAAGDTSEIFLGAGTELCGLSLAAVVYYDVDAADGNMYGELSAGKSYEVGAGATLDLVASIGSTIDGGAADDYVTYGLKAALSKELGDNLTGSIYIAGEITEGVRATSTEGDDLYGGISLSYGF